MILVVSPYHLTTREIPAMAALLLADQAITLLPAPFADSGTGAAKGAAARSPWYARFVDSWSWTVPLWDEGVLASTHEGDDVTHDVRDTADRIRADERFLSLRPLMREELFDTEHTYLSAVGADVIKGGPDPGVTVPVTAGLDRFARRHNLAVLRAHPQSIVQRAEAGMARTQFAVALPVLSQASAETILLAREMLEPELTELRSAFNAFTNSVRDSAADRSAVESAFTAAAARFAAALERDAAEISATDDSDIRTVITTVVMTCATMPVDAALWASVEATHHLLGVTRSAREPRSGTTTLPVPVAPSDAGFVTSLLIKPMGTVARNR